MKPSLDASAADELMAKAGKTFHRAARLLPKTVRGDVVRLYAFCRQVDDLADEPGFGRRARRQSLDALARAFEQKSVPDLYAAGWLFSAHGAMAGAAELLVRAAAQDLDQQQPQSREALLAYAFGVAGTVGIMMARVLRAEPQGLHSAVSLGMAMQLSNIARDIAEDLANGRLYLPLDWVTAGSVQRAISTRTPEDARSVLLATERVLALAESLYEAAFDGIWSLPWRIRWSILAAALCYREIGRDVRRRGTRAWSQRVIISSGRKLWLIAIAGIRLLQPRFWRATNSPATAGLGQVALASMRQLGVA